MHRFGLFVKRIYVFLLFIILEVVAINIYADSTSYTKAKLLTASNSMVGWIHQGSASTIGYFSLKKENRELMEQLVALQNELEQYRAEHPDHDEDSYLDGETAKYFYTSASVINNSVTRQENFIMLDKGTRDGIRSNMALITPTGEAVGYVLSCNDKFSVGISILNTKFRTVGKIKGKGNAGSVIWDGTDRTRVTITELDKYAEIAVGDTIVTGNSLIFPSDLMIGTVKSFEMTLTNSYDAVVDLAADMADLDKLYVVDYADLHQRGELEEEYFDTEVDIELQTEEQE